MYIDTLSLFGLIVAVSCTCAAVYTYLANK